MFRRPSFGRPFVLLILILTLSPGPARPAANGLVGRYSGVVDATLGTQAGKAVVTLEATRLDRAEPLVWNDYDGTLTVTFGSFRFAGPATVYVNHRVEVNAVEKRPGAGFLVPEERMHFFGELGADGSLSGDVIGTIGLQGFPLSLPQRFHAPRVTLPQTDGTGMLDPPDVTGRYGAFDPDQRGDNRFGWNIVLQLVEAGGGLDRHLDARFAFTRTEDRSPLKPHTSSSMRLRRLPSDRGVLTLTGERILGNGHYELVTIEWDDPSLKSLEGVLRAVASGGSRPPRLYGYVGRLSK